MPRPKSINARSLVEYLYDRETAWLEKVADNPQAFDTGAWRARAQEDRWIREAVQELVGGN